MSLKLQNIKGSGGGSGGNRRKLVASSTATAATLLLVALLVAIPWTSAAAVENDQAALPTVWKVWNESDQSEEWLCFSYVVAKGPVGETGKGMDDIGTTGTAFSSADDDDPRSCSAPFGFYDRSDDPSSSPLFDTHTCRCEHHQQQKQQQSCLPTSLAT
uniref:Uncharacterized protein n=1 Tax=Anopheles melas TaxID=34690 RepID=A0A182TKK2_9DIPT